MGRASALGVVESWRDAARVVRGASQRLSGAVCGKDGSVTIGPPSDTELDWAALKQAAAPPHSV